MDVGDNEQYLNNMVNNKWWLEPTHTPQQAVHAAVHIYRRVTVISVTYVNDIALHRRLYTMTATTPQPQAATTPASDSCTRFNFNLVQRALVLGDYAPALGVWEGGVVSRKKGARSLGEEKKEGEKKKKKKSWQVKLLWRKKEEKQKQKHIIMWGLVMFVHAWGSS